MNQTGLPVAECDAEGGSGIDGSGAGDFAEMKVEVVGVATGRARPDLRVIKATEVGCERTGDDVDMTMPSFLPRFAFLYWLVLFSSFPPPTPKFSSPALLFFDTSNFWATVEVGVTLLTICVAVRAEVVGGSCMGATKGPFDISTGAGDSGDKDRRMRVGDNGKSNIG